MDEAAAEAVVAALNHQAARRPPAKPLPPPTPEERATAAEAARALRQVLAHPDTLGEARVVHVDLSNPRRGVWLTTWPALPGFTRWGPDLYTHASLPGWEYTQREVLAEMIPDLERLAETGERPTEATR